MSTALRSQEALLERQPDSRKPVAQGERSSSSEGSLVLSFAGLEYRVDSGELVREGSITRLAPQPARLLLALARRAGAVTTRRDLRAAVWRDEVHVDFEQGLNFCVAELRRALGDCARRPRFVETVPGRGYRFVPSVRVWRRPLLVSLRTEARSTQVGLAVSSFLAIGRAIPFRGYSATLREELIAALLERLPNDYSVVRTDSVLARLPPDRQSRMESQPHLVIEGSLRCDRGPVEVNVRLHRIDPSALLLARRYRFDDSQDAAIDGQKGNDDAGGSLDVLIAERLAADLAPTIEDWGSRRP